MTPQTSEVIDRIECLLYWGTCRLIRCSCCSCYDFEYGSLRMMLDRQGLISFARVVRRLELTSRQKEGAAEKVYLRLGGLNMMLVLRVGELAALRQLLEEGSIWTRGSLACPYGATAVVH